MKKSIIFCITLLLITTFLAGCGDKSKSKKNKNEAEEGKIYNIVSLNDGNVKVFEGIVPKGWKSYISSRWNVVNSTYPGLETVTLSAPDNSAKITIISQTSYTENKKYQEGENYEYYTTYLHTMDASTYLDYYMSNNYAGAKLVKNGIVDDDVLKQLQEYNNLRVELGKKDAASLSTQNYGVSISVADSGVTAAKKEYELGLNYIEAYTAVAGTKTTLVSSYSSLLNSEANQWTIPYTIIFEGETKEAFDKYYDDYNFIVANSQFTVDYYAMTEYVSSCIVNKYTSYYAAKSQAALDATNDYIDSNYSSTSSESTNEKVMQMWDDCINEVDEYVTEDGTKFKTSMFNEVAAQNGDEIYVGSKSGIPEGFTELSKSY